MSKTNRNRLRRVEATLGGVPIPREIQDAAFAHFRATGELPDDLRLGCAVIERAKCGYVATYDHTGRLSWPATLDAAFQAQHRPSDPVMNQLYDEALLGTPFVKAVAQTILRAFAKAGIDPSEPQLVDMADEIPPWGSVAMHLIEFEELVAAPPYEGQAAHLFARYAVLRERVPEDDPLWFDRFGDANQLFHEFGELPEDELLRDAVLADAELRTLVRHATGEDVTEVMRVFEAMATADGEARHEHLTKLVEFAEAGRLLPAG